MRGQRVLTTASVNDVCLFCAFGFSRPSLATRRRAFQLSRSYNSSNSYGRPPGAAYAVAEEEPEPRETRSQNSAPDAFTSLLRRDVKQAVQWKCRVCNYVNFADHVGCKGCGQRRALSSAAQNEGSTPVNRKTSAGPDQMRPGNWGFSERSSQKYGSDRIGTVSQDRRPSDTSPTEPFAGQSNQSGMSALLDYQQQQFDRRPSSNNSRASGRSFTNQDQRLDHFRTTDRSAVQGQAIPIRRVDPRRFRSVESGDSLDRSARDSRWNGYGNQSPIHPRSSEYGNQYPSNSQSGNYGSQTSRSSQTNEYDDRESRLGGSRWSSDGAAFGSGNSAPMQDPFDAADDDYSPVRQRSIRGQDMDGEARIRGRFQREAEDDQNAGQASQFDRQRSNQRQAGNRRWQNNELEEEETFSAKRRNKKEKKRARDSPTRTQIELPEFISVENLATALRVRTEDFIDRMEEMGFERPRGGHVLDAETSGLIASEFNFDPVFSQDARVQDLVARPAPEDASILPTRPPIVTIMGHVDHGKTTILDWLRKSSVVDSEHGGITQHIGAFSVTMPGGKQITFLDTPGHEAFLDMRRRGANVTDIVVLVVAADDSVKPQTIEAIKHATDAKVPMIVAINKVDKEDANVERVKQDLARHGVTVEDFGGDVQAICVSGKLGRGMKELEEATVTLSEILDHRAEADGPVEGWIIESKTTVAGRVATVLVRRGTLRPMDFIVAGTTWARVRNLRNDSGVPVDEAPPGTPVQIDGWRGDDPVAGWEVLQAENEDYAKDVVELRRDRDILTKLAADSIAINATRAEEADARAQVKAEQAGQNLSRKGSRWGRRSNSGWVEGQASSGPKEVHFIVKADVSGSVEAVVNSISAIGNNEIAANIIRSGVGQVNESDVEYLSLIEEEGYIVSFNQSIDATISKIANAAGVPILDHNIIYKVTDAVKQRFSDALPPIVTQKIIGEAEIEKVFDITEKKKVTKIAGCKIFNGLVQRSSRVRVLRGTRIIHDGTVRSLKNVKKDVTEMRKGSDCGMAFADWEDFQEGDRIQCYKEETSRRTLP